jgi:hypothetical protein
MKQASASAVAVAAAVAVLSQPARLTHYQPLAGEAVRWGGRARGDR